MRIANNFIHSVCFCVSVCLSVQPITFELLKLRTSFLVCRYSLTISRSNFSSWLHSIKVKWKEINFLSICKCFVTFVSRGWCSFDWKAFLLPPASEGWRKIIFSLCVSIHTSGGGVPGLRSQIFGGGYQVLDFRGGYQVSDFRRGYQVSDFRGGGYLVSVKGKLAMATRRAVCLLRSRRRTFLLFMLLREYKLLHYDECLKDATAWKLNKLQMLILLFTCCLLKMRKQEAHCLEASVTSWCESKDFKHPTGRIFNSDRLVINFYNDCQWDIF